MSIETWKAEYYPCEAKDATDSIQHSLTKWIGLRKENLDRHGLLKGVCELYTETDGGVFKINNDTCALCIEFLCPGAADPCVRCPLYKHLGHACDNGDGEDDQSPYHSFIADDDPEPMIVALSKLKH